jgi:hypothetical protein
MRILVLVLVLFCSSLAGAQERRSVLDEVRFPRLEFRDATVTEIIVVLRSKVLGDSKPDWYEGAFPFEVRFAPARMSQAVTFNVENATLRETLAALGKEAGITFRVIDDRIVFDELPGQPREGKSQADAVEKEPWGGLDLRGCRIKLKSDKDYIYFSFMGNGAVAVSWGHKNGAISAPLLRYRKSGKWLQILDDDGKLLFQMVPTKTTADELTLENGSGETQVFEILH